MPGSRWAQALWLHVRSLFPAELDHGSRSSNPIWTSRVKGTDVSHRCRAPGLHCVPAVGAAGGDGILNVLVYFPPDLCPSPLLVCTFLRGRTQDKANAQKGGSCESIPITLYLGGVWREPAWRPDRTRVSQQCCLLT